MIAEPLDQLGFAEWYKQASGKRYAADPWLAYRSALDASSDLEPPLRTIVDLFIRGRTISKSDLLSTIGDLAAGVLEEHEVLSSTSTGQISSRFCLVHAINTYLFVNWPVGTPSGRLCSQGPYLGTTSYELWLAVNHSRRVKRALDLGCGAGLIASSLSSLANQTVAVDIDENAVEVSRLNLVTNGASADIRRGHWDKCIGADESFDLILANPPWALVPPAVKYPDQMARLGSGRDGLGYVRQALGAISRLLAPGGEAILRFDLPFGAAGAERLISRDGCLMSAGLDVTSTIFAVVLPEDQARISSDLCWQLNPEVDGLPERFLAYYRALNIDRFAKLVLRIRRNDG
jgi:SAM-dependent methyltransferase